MNIRHKVSALAVSLLALGTVSLAQAATFTSATSDSYYVNVGASTVNGGPHTSGYAGIGVRATGIDQLVDFKGLSAYAAADSNGVRSLSYASSLPTDHSQMGVFKFVQIGSSDVWFGEWSQTASASDGTHTVYYVGDSTGATVPTSGTASYAVKGVSNYGANGILTGTFNANFGTSSLSGTLTNSASTYTINTAINASSASFSGVASVSNLTGTTGTVTGNFYGANAASLAGIASFGSHSVYDVAFGGTKN